MSREHSGRNDPARTARRYRAAVKRWVPLAAVALAVAACSGDPQPSRVPTGPVRAQAQRFDSVRLNNDHKVLRIEFIGGSEFRPDDPCSNLYQAVATEVAGVLEVAVTDVTPVADLGPDVACDSAGHLRRIDLVLDAPFEGTTGRDVAGYLHFVRPPPDLVERRGLPAAWSLRDEATVQESPTGRWARTYSPDELPTAPERTLQLYQSFGGPVHVSGGEEIRQARSEDRRRRCTARPTRASSSSSGRSVATD
jgi:hypothetical protein